MAYDVNGCRESRYVESLRVQATDDGVLHE